MRPAMITAAIAIGAAACASAAGGRSGASAPSRAACSIAQADSVFARTGPVYRECAVDRKAREVSTRVDFRPSDMRSECYFADVEFVVDTSGVVELSTARVTGSNDDTFARAVADALPQWRFTPARLDGHVVRQIVLNHTVANVRTVIVPRGSGPPASPPPSHPTC